MEVIVEQNRCTGCGICETVCPTRSISMRANEKGFLYPYINAATCCHCGQCANVCPVIHTSEIWRSHNSISEVYAAWSRDKALRYSSTSGGVFSELARNVLDNGGCVAGAGYTANHLVKHMLIEDIADLPLLRQSKYVQSCSGSIFLEVEEKLREDRKVLFVGTPCQCAALKQVLGKEYDRLLLCDFICRGVNAPAAYLAYLHDLEEKYRSKIVRVWFKNKRDGWTRFGTRIDFDNGDTYFGSRYDDDFMYGFIRKNLNLYLRPSCTQCGFKGISRPTDLTLGDFWGITPHNDSDLGVSVVLLHTEKGRQAFLGLSGVTYEKKTVEEALRSNECLEGSACISKESAYFWKQMQDGIAFHEIILKIKNKMGQEEIKQ